MGRAWPVPPGGDRVISGHCLSYRRASNRPVHMWSSPAPRRGRTSRSGRRLNISEKSRFRQRHARPIAHDDVIEKPDVHQREGLLDTQRVEEALALVDIRLLDHIIVGDGASVSLAESGLL